MFSSCTFDLFLFSISYSHNHCSNNTQAAVNQDHKKNNDAQEYKKYPGKTLLNQGKNPTIPLLYCQEKIHHPPPKPSTQEGASKTEKTSSYKSAICIPHNSDHALS
jgi:hypothetical protein